MGESLPEQLRDWHDFYVLMGTAGATLAGLVFVAISLGTRLLNQDNLAGWRTYTDQPLLSFATALAKAGVLLVPTLTGLTLGALLCLIGAANLGYSGFLVRQLVRARQQRPLSAADWLWQVTAPLLGSVLTLGAGVGFLLGEREVALSVTAFVSLLLLLVGIRNAWNMVLWVAARTDESK